ncbi:MAG TPA: MBL fold metallo-hydrolase [Thermoanaerobaculia bacterium]|nr:MBL fold metallo-hydrolase [Thermoanaerobaculia bacterium]
MSGETNNRLLPDFDRREIKVRLYGQGLGDCFLLAFPRKDKPQDPCYLVIDCGVAMSTPGKDVRIKKVVEDVRIATGGHVDALAVTHQHFDHISGFQDAWQEWKKITVDAVYLPWTEATAEKGEHSGTADFRNVLDQAAKKAMEKAAEMGTLASHPGFRAEADFLGVSLEAAGSSSGKIKGPANMDEAMAFARGLCPPGKIRYFEPGDVLRLPETDFHAYVLGPPLPGNVNPDGKKYIELLVDGSDGVMYSYGPLGLKVDAGKPGGANAFALSDDRSLPAMASALLAEGDLSRESDEGFSPFAPEIRLDWESAMASPFFRAHYSATKERGEDGAWRRVDSDWLAGAAALALRAGTFTNNVSLVLAFDVPGSEKMLLFPGDAQVGNWLSWHTIEKWRFLDSSAPAKPPAANDKQTLMENLLSRVAFYKVGHHASHNATIQDQGLEKMTHEDLVAFIPVSVPVAQDLMGYCPMPFYPVVRALQRKTKGRVFLPNGHAVGPLPDGKKDEDLLAEARIRVADEKLPEMKNQVGKTLEGEVPLYLEVTVAG